MTDSTCDLPAEVLEELGIGVVPGRVMFGSENYLDKVTITPAEFYARFARTDVVPTTSQPPPADFTQVYTNVGVHAGSIVSIHLSAALSGIYQASLVGARAVPDTRFVHMDSRTVSVGLGLVVRAAARAAAGALDGGGRPDGAGTVDRVRMFIALPTLDHLVRGGRVSAMRAGSPGCFACLPLLTLSGERKGSAGRAWPAATRVRAGR